MGRGVQHNVFGRRLLAFYNARGIFGNAEDDAEGLRSALEGQFHDVEIWQRGTVVLFTARK
jgi:hypothetical protein